jgi:hypothetical protein
MSILRWAGPTQRTYFSQGDQTDLQIEKKVLSVVQNLMTGAWPSSRQQRSGCTEGGLYSTIYRTLTLQTNKIEDERWNDVIFYSINI